MVEGFDPALVFDEDFRYFYADRVGEARTQAELAVLRRVLGRVAGEALLDVCCGEGRISSALSTDGARLVGIDRSLPYLETARRDGGASYVCGDSRRLPFRAAFDVALCWYTSFGYFSDDDNRAALSEMRRALRPGGRLVIDLDARDHLLKSGLPTQVRERGEDVMVEQFSFDRDSSQVRVRRTVVRGEEARTVRYFVRVFSEDELRDWLADARLVDVTLLGEDGEPFSPRHRRMIALARRPPSASATRR